MNGYSETIAALKKGSVEQPQLRESVDLCCKLLELQSRLEVPAAAIETLSPEEARGRLQRGLPLLSSQELDIDAGRLTDLAMQIAFAVAECRRERVRQLADIHSWLHRHRQRMRALAVAYLSGNEIPYSKGVDRALLAFVMQNALYPFLRARAKSLSRLVDASSWYRGYCPICGGEPDIAALEKGGGRRRLLCSRCDFEWTVRRLGCPFCGNDDPKDLAFLPGPDEAHGLAACDRCRRCLKTVDFREAPERPLAAERILSSEMDVCAESTGYRTRA